MMKVLADGKVICCGQEMTTLTPNSVEWFFLNCVCSIDLWFKKINELNQINQSHYDNLLGKGVLCLTVLNPTLQALYRYLASCVSLYSDRKA